MRKLLLSIALLAGVTVTAQAQTGNTAPAKGTNPNPNAPVNLSDPALRPAEPAMYSSTPVPDGQKGQFYVKDDKPATSDGQIITPATHPQPSKEDMMRKSAATPGAAPATKTNTPAGAKGRAAKSAK